MNDTARHDRAMNGTGTKDLGKRLTEAALAALKSSGRPMTPGQLRTAVAQGMKVPPVKRFREQVEASLMAASDVHRWPAYNRGPVFCSRALVASLEEAVLEALESEPLTVAKAGTAVKKRLATLTEKRVVKEMKSLLPRLATSGKVLKLAANRQSFIYLSRSWMAKQARPDGGDSSLTAVLLQTIARLQAESGTYVWIDNLRKAPEILALVDDEIMRLADRRELVLSNYGGPRPVPASEKHRYAEDAHGELFIGVALKRA